MKKLDRELGLFSAFSLSCGAMIGSGIFVLPGLAVSIGGPAAFLAYAFAGMLVLPAALSKAEMATALPESGGTYLYMDRSLGPFAGTLTGMGTWISLILKSSFALVGLSAYLFLITPGLSPSAVKYLAMGIAIFLILLNLVGVKKTGTIQSILVFITLTVLVIFVLRGSIVVEKEHFKPFFKKGYIGFISSAAFIFVSYAGVTKIASVAEEIKNPDRNIPWGILLSLITMMLIYTVVAYVIVGVVPFEELTSGKYRLTPVALAGKYSAGQIGFWVLTVVAILALISMANAGILSSSRYPLAMARDNHLPEFLSRVHPRFSTPYASILLTGGILLLFILLLPVKELAKLASVFKLMVFSLVNIAVIVFRESEIEWYKPEFKSPLYPYAQIAGFLGSFSLIVVISIYDWFPLVGATGLIVICIVWYLTYAKDRMEREGALWRKPAGEEEIEMFEKVRSKSTVRKETVILPFFGLKEVDAHTDRRIRLAAALCAEEERLDIVHFIEVPEQTFLSGYNPDPEIERALQERINLLRNEIENDIHFDEVVTHSSRGAIRNYAEEEKPHWIVFDWKEPSPWQFLLGKNQKWWLEDFPTDLLFYDDRGNIEFEDILVITDPGPYDGEVVYAADHIAGYYEGNITFLNPVPGDSQNKIFIEDFQQEMMRMCQTDSSSKLIPVSEWVETVLKKTEDADLLIVGGLTQKQFAGMNNHAMGEQIAKHAKCSVARIQSSLRSPRSVFSRKNVDEPANRDKFLSSYLKPENIEIGLEAKNKHHLFEILSEKLSTDTIKSEQILKRLLERENVQATYIGHGIALPHAIVENYDRTLLFIALLKEEIPYTREDDPVKLCAMTVGPPSDRQGHLEIISRITKILLDDEKRDTLLSARGKEDISNILLNSS